MTKEQREEMERLAKAEHIYEPKYGGKDHSGYDTMMKYEINYEREEAFCNGFTAGVESEKQRARVLVEALEKIKSVDYMETLTQVQKPTEYAFSSAKGYALSKIQKIVKMPYLNTRKAANNEAIRNDFKTYRNACQSAQRHTTSG